LSAADDAMARAAGSGMHRPNSMLTPTSEPTHHTKKHTHTHAYIPCCLQQTTQWLGLLGQAYTGPAPAPFAGLMAAAKAWRCWGGGLRSEHKQAQRTCVRANKDTREWHVCGFCEFEEINGGTIYLRNDERLVFLSAGILLSNFGQM